MLSYLLCAIHSLVVRHERRWVGIGGLTEETINPLSKFCERIILWFWVGCAGDMREGVQLRMRDISSRGLGMGAGSRTL